MEAAIDLRTAQDIFEAEYHELRRRAASALYNRIMARPGDREELIQNVLCHVWNAWLSVCRRGAFQGMKPNHRLLRLVHWHAKLRRTFGHQYRNRWSWHDGSHGCIPIEEVMAPGECHTTNQAALEAGQTGECRQRVEIGEEVTYRQTR